MTQWHEKSARKETGGIRRTMNGRSKRLHQKGGDFSATTMETVARNKTMKGRGNTYKTVLTKALTASVTDSATQKTRPMKIIWVHENAANRLYVRRNIITKGTLIEVEANGEKTFARVTSRPGQDGNVTAVVTGKPAEAKKAAPRAARTGKVAKKTITKKSE